MLTGSFNVMQVISDLEIGGAQECVRTLSANLADLGCRPVVCTFKDGPLRYEIEKLGIPVEILPERRYSVLAFPLFLLDLIRIRQALLKVVDRYQIQVIQTHLLRSLDFLVATFRFRKDVQVFWTFQNAAIVLREDQLPRHRWMLRPKRFAHRWLYRLFGKWVNGWIAVSDDVAKSILESIGPLQDKITVICNSVDLRRFQNGFDRTCFRQALRLPENAPVMAVVATFKRQKGHRHLLDALPAVITRFPDLKVVLVGDGDLREELVAQTKELNLKDHVHFLGLRKDIPELLAASDYFVLPSLWEGLSLALVEAMASGLPVVATDVSGTRQVMVHGETGLLVSPGNVPELSQALVTMLSMPARAKEMGIAGRRRVEEYFSARKQAIEHINLYLRERKRFD
jgi:glycosyltransferase involved in cell wall biosynthesis